MTKVNKSIIYALLGLVVLVLLFKVARPEKQTDIQVAQTPAKQLQMEWHEVVPEGVSSDEKVRIVEFVDTFEHAVAQRESDKALSFFSAPETDEEQKELDFILGSDIARNDAKSSAQRLFTTTGYNYSLGAHYVRAVAAQGANRRVIVDEMRIVPSGGEWVGTVANVSRMVVELQPTSHGYEIIRYFHDGKDGKYEGFVAE